MPRILIIDDDAQVRAMLRLALERDGHNAEEAENGKIGVGCYRERRHDLVLCDIFMPEQDGLETIRQLVAEFPSVAIIATSGSGRFAGMDPLVFAARFGASATLHKPFSLDELRFAIAAVLDRPDIQI